MSQDYSNNKRIAKNTFFLYIRMMLIMVVSLYTSRVVLSTLGVVDYGIQNVVGGLVSMFSMISGTISTTISRFLTFELGKGNGEKLKRLFSTAMNIQLGTVLLVFIIAETLGLWFLNYKMTIPEERMLASNWVYQFSLASFAINLLCMPYNATIIAHEKMSSFAYISILEVTLKLVIVYLLIVSPWDQLVVYSALLFGVSLIIFLIYSTYCRHNFGESHYCFVFDRLLFKEMSVFAGWNYLGAGASILRTQGLNVLMNVFFGPVVNAARGISSQVEAATTQFVTNFTMALNPQIIKSYAKGDKDYMYKLVCAGAKYSYYMVLLLILPIIIEAHFILKIWLGIIPDYTIVFLRLTLIIILIDSLSTTLVTSMQASGKIKTYQIIIGIIMISTFPLSYIAFQLGYPPESCYLVCIFAMLVKLAFQLPLIRNMVGLPISHFLHKVINKALFVSIILLPIPLFIHYIVDIELFRLFLVCASDLCWGALVIYCIGLDNEEKQFVRAKLRFFVDKILK